MLRLHASSLAHLIKIIEDTLSSIRGQCDIWELLMRRVNCDGPSVQAPLPEIAAVLYVNDLPELYDIVFCCTTAMLQIYVGNGDTPGICR